MNLFSRLVEIDAHLPKDELDRLECSVDVEIDDIFSMDVDGDCTKVDSVKSEAACFSHTLDICLRKIFMYMKTTCYDDDGNLM